MRTQTIETIFIHQNETTLGVCRCETKFCKLTSELTRLCIDRFRSDTEYATRYTNNPLLYAIFKNTFVLGRKKHLFNRFKRWEREETFFRENFFFHPTLIWKILRFAIKWKAAFRSIKQIEIRFLILKSTIHPSHVQLQTYRCANAKTQNSKWNSEQPNLN